MGCGGAAESGGSLFASYRLAERVPEREIPMSSDVMNAINLMKSQHRTMRLRFVELRAAKTFEHKRRIFEDLADVLAVHVAIGDRQFYPAVRARKHGEQLLAKFSGHLNIKRVLSDLLQIDTDRESFTVKLRLLREVVEHHMRQEENEVFPQVKRLLGEVQLAILGREMGMEAERIESAGSPRLRVNADIARAPLGCMARDEVP